jgi:hypothetical protein
VNGYTFFSSPFTKVASVGDSLISSFIAPLVRACAFASNNLPNNTKVRITVTASKYRNTLPSAFLNWARNTSGKSKATMLKINASPAPKPNKYI